MNILFRMEKGIAVCLFSSFFVLACVNHIPGEKAAVSNGDIPLKFTADIHEVTYTRVAGNGFEENDEVGVFALVGSSTMKEERYADNLRFFRTSEKVFESSEPIYYPDDEVTLRLISYYPYQEEGVNMGESTMSVAVETDQNLSAGYFCSDFLVASQNLQSAPKGAIALHYDHKFFKLKIALIYLGVVVDIIFSAVIIELISELLRAFCALLLVGQKGFLLLSFLLLCGYYTTT